MKIAFFVGDFPALSETFVLNQVTGLLDRGHEVHIVACRSRGEASLHPDVISYGLLQRVRYGGVPNSYLSRLVGALKILLRTPHKDLLPMLQTLNVVRSPRGAVSLRLLYYAGACRGLPPFDVLLCHGGPHGLLAMELREIGLVSGKLLTFFHGSDVSSFLEERGRDVYGKLFNLGDLFLPISEYWQKKLISLGCRPEKIKIHRMGIDTQRFVYRSKPWDGKAPLRLVTVARLVEKKGIEFGIRAVSELIKNNMPVVYTIVGDGPLRTNLLECIEKLGVGEQVRMIGAKNHFEVEKVLAESHVLLAPSVTSSSGDQEGIPVAIMEAMAVGLFVISTEHSGIPELVQDGVTGFLAPEKKVKSLVDKLLLLFANPDLLSEVPLQGYKKVAAMHDVNNLNDQLDLLLSEKTIRYKE